MALRVAVPCAQMLLEFAPLWLGLQKHLLEMNPVHRANLVGMDLHAWQLRMASMPGTLYGQEAFLLRRGGLGQEAVLLRTGDLWRKAGLLRMGHPWRERPAPGQDAGA